MLSVFTGCNTAETTTTTTLKDVEIAENVEIHFWHAMGGGLGETMEAVCDMFNAENEYGITVIPTYQGKYPDTHAKVVAAITAGEAPHMAQAYANNIMIYK